MPFKLKAVKKKKNILINKDLDSETGNPPDELAPPKRRRQRKASFQKEKKKTIDELKSELDEHTWLELKHFSHRFKPKPPNEVNHMVRCGSLYDGIDPNTGVLIKEAKRKKRNTRKLS